MVFKHY